MAIKSFRGFLSESKDMLDISIQSAKKFLTSEKNKEYFLFTEVFVEAKTDGIKLTVLKIDNTGDYTKDYIFSYKRNILYSEEFNYTSNYKTKKESIGASQFKLVFEHFKKLPKNNIPAGTELQIEYLMKKPTLSSNYKYPHKMVLIAHSKSSYTVKFGKLRTKPSGFLTDKREEYANILKINTPLKIFKGILGTQQSFEKGILNKSLKDIFDSYKNSINWTDYDSIINAVTEMFLEIPSFAGGKEEGVVLKYPDRLLKIQQVYQVDQAARTAIKNKFRDTPENEAVYWANVKNSANELIRMVPKDNENINELLAIIADNLKRYKLTFTHPKKTDLNIKDDIQMIAKKLLIKSLPGNNNALIVGRFQPLTLGHQRMFYWAFKDYDEVWVDIVKGSKPSLTNPFDLNLQMEMIKAVYPKINIITSRTANLFTIINKIPDDINVIFAGSDRVQAYRNQLKTSDVVVREIKRTDKDISATKVREAIIKDDYDTFKEMTDKKIHSFYDRLRSEIMKFV